MGEIQHIWLDRKKYEGYKLTFSYCTDRCYHVNATDLGMTLEERKFPTVQEKQFTDELFGDWLEKPVALGAFDGDTLAGVIEGSAESWHNVFRISNILVMEPYRGKGIGRELMNRMLEYARSIPNCRGTILETQSCNYPAISFYRKQGFALSRIDLREYSNEDVQRNEVRLDFFLPFKDAEKEG
ncbi:MAG: GNAT family N-acetyltransferase [Oscillospiraceae bacterium]|nr:GNAT family N-acetyltransferase [Oscillospiraceae bacterium]